MNMSDIFGFLGSVFKKQISDFVIKWDFNNSKEKKSISIDIERYFNEFEKRSENLSNKIMEIIGMDKEKIEELEKIIEEHPELQSNIDDEKIFESMVKINKDPNALPDFQTKIEAFGEVFQEELIKYKSGGNFVRLKKEKDLLVDELKKISIDTQRNYQDFIKTKGVIFDDNITNNVIKIQEELFNEFDSVLEKIILRISR